jgi:serine/threonine protein phosphatase PrpC
MTSSYNFIFSTHVGNVRKNNEDYYGEKKLPGGHVFVVCDGMGGHSGGEIASKKAVECILDYFSRSRGENAVQMIHEAIKFANSQIHGFACTYPEYTGMGTTCVVVYLTDSLKLYYGHVGDSRLYLRSKNGVTVLTKDHSYVQFLVDTGEIKEEEMESHPSKNQILRALGIDEVVKPEVCPEPLSPHPGDLFLLCSDGLNGMVDKYQLEKLLLSKGSGNTLKDKADELIQAALEGGGKDNVTVGLLRIGAEIEESTQQVPSPEQPKKTGLSRFQKLAFLIILALAAILAGVKFLQSKLSDNTPVPTEVDGQQPKDEGKEDTKEGESNGPQNQGENPTDTKTDSEESNEEPTAPESGESAPDTIPGLGSMEI